MNIMYGGSNRNIHNNSYNNNNSNNNKKKKKEGDEKTERDKKRKSSASDDEDDDHGYEESKKSHELKEIYRVNNHITFYNEVDRKSILKLINLIREAEEYCVLTSMKLRIPEIPIYLHIYSYGGCVSSAFAAVDTIQSSKVPIYSVIEGETASAGTIISIVCKKRFIRPNGFMLIHQLSSGCWGKMAEIIDEYNNMTMFMNKITEIYSTYSTLSEKKLGRLLKHDLWLDSAKAIKYGLVDELYT